MDPLETISWPILPLELVHSVLRRCSLKGLVFFEAACKGNRALTDYTWKILRTEYCLEYSWQACQGKPDQNRWNFILGYVAKKHSPESLPALQKHFPDKFPRDVQPIPNTGKLGGELLLDLFSIPIEDLPLEEIINLLLPHLDLFELISSYHISEAKIVNLIASIARKTKNFGPLFEYLAKATEDRHYQFPVKLRPQKGTPEDLALQAFVSTEKLPIKLNRFLEAIKAYEPNVPASVLIGTASVKSHFQDTSDIPGANDLYTRALKKYGNRAPVFLLNNAALVKLELRDLQDADDLFTRALQKCGDLAPVNVLANAALIKLKLGHLQDANDLYTRALQKYGDQAPENVLANAAHTKLKLGHLQDADGLYKQSLQKYGNQAPAYVLTRAAETKLRLERFQEADDLYTQSLQKYGNQAPAFVLVDAAETKLRLERFQEADDLCGRILRKEGDQASASNLSFAGLIKKKLGHFQEAKDLYKRALQKYGDQVPEDVKAEAASIPD